MILSIFLSIPLFHKRFYLYKSSSLYSYSNSHSRNYSKFPLPLHPQSETRLKSTRHLVKLPVEWNCTETSSRTDMIKKPRNDEEPNSPPLSLCQPRIRPLDVPWTVINRARNKLAEGKRGSLPLIFSPNKKIFRNSLPRSYYQRFGKKIFSSPEKPERGFLLYLSSSFLHFGIMKISSK